MYVGILQAFAETLNFQFRIFTNGQSGFGTFENNRTTGMLKILHDKKADLLAGAMSITLAREPFVGVLPPLSKTLPAIFIKRQLEEEFELLTFLKPFTISLWCVIFGSAMVFAAILHFKKYPNCIKVRTQNSKFLYYPMTTSLSIQLASNVMNFVGWFWINLMSNFGGNANIKMISTYWSMTSNRCIIFTCLMSGTIMWMAYRASLTTELTTVTMKYPFNSLETLLDTDYV